jgi:ABC-2 type transport system permease protein
MTGLTLNPPPAATPARTALHARLITNETAKGLRLMWRRRTMTLVSIVLGAVNYLGISLFIGGGHLVKDLMVLTLPALLAVVIASNAAIQASGGIAEEINGGTLEQIQLSPAPPQTQILGRIAALAIETTAAAVILALALTSALGLHYHWHPAVLIPGLLTVADALGYALLIAALTVRVTSIGAITHVFNMAIMVFGGMIVPVTVFPHDLQIFARLIPTTLGVQAVNATLTGAPLSRIWTDATLPWLLAHTAVLFTAGLAIYTWAIRRARREGGLSPR